jgi:hypothetical protein
MRLSRIKTLAAIVGAACSRCGVGVLALGRAMSGQAAAKHRIKRVWRFFRNEAVERPQVQEAILLSSIPRRGRLVILVDWTDLPPYRTLILAVARGGRSIPFFSATVPIKGRGSMTRAERSAVDFLRRILPPGRRVVIVGDRGFGSVSWVRQLRALGWSYVLRLRSRVQVCTDAIGGKLGDLGVRPGDRARHWGATTLSDHRPTATRLVSAWRAGTSQPWFLATDMTAPADAIVDLYARRMWIELTIRDLKNRRWGLGLGDVRLSEPGRMDRLLLVVMLAYFFLFAYGVVAERAGLAEGLKANTVSRRVLSLATTGFLLFRQLKIPLVLAVKQMAVRENS